MQGGTQVGWDPVSINYHLPWESRILILYLLLVVATSAVKSASVLRILWSLTRGSLRVTSNEDEFLSAWKRCSNMIQSMERLVFVTMFWIAFVTAVLLRSMLLRLVEQKMFSLAAFGGNVAEVMAVCALGFFVCAILYTACALYEGALSHRRESWNYARSAIQNHPGKP